jgi:hypothetical protein
VYTLHLADVLIQIDLQGQLLFKCLAQVHINRFSTEPTLRFEPATFQLLAPCSKSLGYLPVRVIWADKVENSKFC